MKLYKFLILILVITLSGCNNITKRVESRKMFLPKFVTLLKSADYENIDELPLAHDEDIIRFKGSTLRVDPKDIINDDNLKDFRRNKDYLIIYENGEKHIAYSVKLSGEEGLFFISMKQFHTVFDILTINIDIAENIYKSAIKGTNLDRNLSDLNETNIKEYKDALRSDVVLLKLGGKGNRSIELEPPW